MKFVHTADWQMGMQAKIAGEKARDVRNARYESALAIVKVAKENQADFVLIAGDTFEHENVGAAVIKRTVEILNAFAPIPVYVLPGNHDPLRSGGIWSQSDWIAVGSHVHLCGEAKEVELPLGAALYPCPLKQKQSRSDPTEWIPPRSPGDERIRIGFAHGSLSTLPGTPNFPIAADRPTLSGLSYLALGDWHGHLMHGKIAYSGTHEQTAFDESDPANVLLVEVTSYLATPRVEKLSVGRLVWRKKTKTIQSADDVAALRNEIAVLADPKRLLLRVQCILDTSAPEVARQLEGLQEILAETLFLLDWEVTRSNAAVAELYGELPEGTLQRMDEVLAMVLDGRIPEEPCRLVASASREVVQEARMKLHSLVRELQR